MTSNFYSRCCDSLSLSSLSLSGSRSFDWFVDWLSVLFYLDRDSFHAYWPVAVLFVSRTFLYELARGDRLFSRVILVTVIRKARYLEDFHSRHNGSSPR